MMTISFSGSLTRSVPLKDSSSFAPCSSTTAVSSLPPPSFSSLFLNASRHCSPNLRESHFCIIKNISAQLLCLALVACVLAVLFLLLGLFGRGVFLIGLVWWKFAPFLLLAW